jgi:hypothetical protein
VDAYDGVTKISWSDMNSFIATMGNESAQKASEELLADERNFVDFETSTIKEKMTTRPRQLKPNPKTTSVRERRKLYC